MNVALTPNWSEVNQRHLSAALAQVRRQLEEYARQTGAIGVASEQCDVDETGAFAADTQLAPPAALQTLCGSFGLTPFERDVLVFCAGVELDERFAAICGALAGARRGHATFGLALAALTGAHWSALASAAPLRHWRMVEVTSNEPLTASQLRLDERILHYLVGISFVDERLHGLLTPVAMPDVPSPAKGAVSSRIAVIWSQQPPGTPHAAVQVCGAAPADRAATIAAACEALGARLWRLRAADIPQAIPERSALARLCERELTLMRGVLLLDCERTEAVERTAVPFVEEMGARVAIAARDPLRLEERASVRFDVEKPQPAEQRALWYSALGPIAVELGAELDPLIAQFSLNYSQIAAARRALSEAESGNLAARLWDACRVQARGHLDDLAHRIEMTATWDDLVLPEPQLDVLREIAIHVRRAHTVYETWGFARKGSRGLGISALFAGASGTGKTMAAEVLANELRLDLYRIDLAQVVSKYIGETEKNLRRIFDAAEQSGAILLFDEADALFGKRSEVKDSHDRYANIEVSYLLQRMEDYRGLAVLTTNMKSALDQAFLRRIRFVIQFPFPDGAQRAEIWRRIFPAETPTQDLNHALLARLNIPGGNIRSIALNAAFLAAEDGTPVRMAHLRHAAQNEYAKLEKPLTSSELAGWN
jgi:hypothetical protein